MAGVPEPHSKLQRPQDCQRHSPPHGLDLIHVSIIDLSMNRVPSSLSPPNDTDAIELEYASVNRSPVKPPIVQYEQGCRWLRAAWITLLAAISSFWLHMLLTFVLLLIVLISSIVALLLIHRARRRSRDDSIGYYEIAPRAHSTRLLLLIAALLLITSTLLIKSALVVDRLARSVSSISVARSHLRGLGGGIWIHADEFGPPKSLWEVVSSNTWSNVIAPMDPIRANPAGTPNGYTSYVYFPPLPSYFDDGATPSGNKIIMLFERGAWHWQDAKLFGGPCRCVRFLDFDTSIDESEFAQVLEEDRKARRKLGWPVYEWDPVNGKVIQIE